MLYDEDHQSVDDCMSAFIDKFSTEVESLLTLDTNDDNTSEVEKKQHKESKKEHASAAKALTKIKKDKEPSDEWKAQQTCYGCGAVGHIRTDCPSRKTAAQPVPPAKKIGRLSMGFPEEEVFS